MEIGYIVNLVIVRAPDSMEVAQSTGLGTWKMLKNLLNEELLLL